MNTSPDRPTPAGAGTPSSTGEASGAATSPAPGKRTRWLARIVFMALVAAGVTLGLQFWQERSLRLAADALEQGQARYARYLLDQFLEKHPDHPRALALQARALVKLGLPDEAIACFDRAGAATAEDLHAWAQALMLKSQWSHALPLLNRVLELEPDNPDALYETAACQVRLGRLTEALKNAEQLTRNSPHAARGYVFVGTILGDLGNHDKAAKAFAEVLRREPQAENLQVTPDEFYLQYGRTFLLLGKPQESLDPLKRSVAVRENPEAFVLLGNAAMQLGEPEKAAQAWQKALSLQSTNREAREALANLALQGGRADEALAWLQPLESMPDLPASTAYLFQRTHTLLANADEMQKWREITEKQRRLEELKGDIDVLFLESPNSFWARVIRAHRFAESGNWSEAELLLKRLLQEAPAETFVIELADAVYRRVPSQLPPIEKLPIEHF